MENLLLNQDIQDFIHANLTTNIARLLLSRKTFQNIDIKAIVNQIEAKQRCEKKLPTWYAANKIYYPNKLNIAQTSSETAASYKANLVSGKTLIDITGGFGVDAFYFSKRFSEVYHCEIDSKLSEIVKHNYDALNISNVTCLAENGIDALKRMDNAVDCIYVDPSRRDTKQQKVFLLADCSPNIKTFQGLFLKYAKTVMIKTSPLLDLSATLQDLNCVKDIHVVAINNEVKELLWVSEQNYTGEIHIKTVNIQNDNTQHFNYVLLREAQAAAIYAEPKTYLYEPNAALLKAGAFNVLSEHFHISKLHKHSHIYTSSELVNFPGRCFKIEKTIVFHKKSFAKEGIKKANITTRNFPLPVQDIRKKLNIKDGGSIYLFFTTDIDNQKIIIVCTKVNRY